MSLIKSPVCFHTFDTDSPALKDPKGHASVSCACGNIYPVDQLLEYGRARAAYDTAAMTLDQIELDLVTNIVAAFDGETIREKSQVAASAGSPPRVITDTTSAKSATTEAPASKSPRAVRPKRVLPRFTPQQILLTVAAAIAFVGITIFLGSTWTVLPLPVKAVLVLVLVLASGTGAMLSRRYSMALANFLATFSSLLLFAGLWAPPLLGLGERSWAQPDSWYFLVISIVATLVTYGVAIPTKLFGWRMMGLVGIVGTTLLGTFQTFSGGDDHDPAAWGAVVASIGLVALLVARRFVRVASVAKPATPRTEELTDEQREALYQYDLHTREAGALRYFVRVSAWMLATVAVVVAVLAFVRHLALVASHAPQTHAAWFVFAVLAILWAAGLALVPTLAGKLSESGGPSERTLTIATVTTAVFGSLAVVDALVSIPSLSPLIGLVIAVAVAATVRILMGRVPAFAKAPARVRIATAVGSWLIVALEVVWLLTRLDEFDSPHQLTFRILGVVTIAFAAVPLVERASRSVASSFEFASEIIVGTLIFVFASFTGGPLPSDTLLTVWLSIALVILGAAQAATPRLFSEAQKQTGWMLTGAFAISAVGGLTTLTSVTSLLVVPMVVTALVWSLSRFVVGSGPARLGYRLDGYVLWATGLGTLIGQFSQNNHSAWFFGEFAWQFALYLVLIAAFAFITKSWVDVALTTVAFLLTTTATQLSILPSSDNSVNQEWALIVLVFSYVAAYSIGLIGIGLLAVRARIRPRAIMLASLGVAIIGFGVVEGQMLGYVEDHLQNPTAQAWISVAILALWAIAWAVLGTGTRLGERLGLTARALSSFAIAVALLLTYLHLGIWLDRLEAFTVILIVGTVTEFVVARAERLGMIRPVVLWLVATFAVTNLGVQLGGHTVGALFTYIAIAIATAGYLVLVKLRFESASQRMTEIILYGSFVVFAVESFIGADGVLAVLTNRPIPDLTDATLVDYLSPFIGVIAVVLALALKWRWTTGLRAHVPSWIMGASAISQALVIARWTDARYLVAIVASLVALAYLVDGWVTRAWISTLVGYAVGISFGWVAASKLQDLLDGTFGQLFTSISLLWFALATLVVFLRLKQRPAWWYWILPATNAIAFVVAMVSHPIHWTETEWVISLAVSIVYGLVATINLFKDERLALSMLTSSGVALVTAYVTGTGVSGAFTEDGHSTIVVALGTLIAYTFALLRKNFIVALIGVFFALATASYAYVTMMRQTHLEWDGPDILAALLAVALVSGSVIVPRVSPRPVSRLLTVGLPLAVATLPSAVYTWGYVTQPMFELTTLQLTREIASAAIGIALLALGIRFGSRAVAIVGAAVSLIVLLPNIYFRITEIQPTAVAFEIGAVYFALILASAFQLLGRWGKFPSYSLARLGLPLAIALTPAVWNSLTALSRPALDTGDFVRFGVVVAISATLLVVGSLRNLAGLVFPGALGLLITVIPYLWMPLSSINWIPWVLLIIIAAFLVMVAVRLDRAKAVGRTVTTWMKELR